MPYTPPVPRSPAPSAPHSPVLSRRSSYQPGQTLGAPPSNRPELPRSTSYLTRQRRGGPIKTAPTSVPVPNDTTPPQSADDTTKDAVKLIDSPSLRQSPPPVTGDSRMPAGAVVSPPDSAQNSSDDEESKSPRGRHMENVNLEELQAAIRTIGQRRASSPTDTQTSEKKAPAPPLALVMPTPPLPQSEERKEAPTVTRKLGHQRSSTEASVFLDLRSSAIETPTEGSDEDSDGDRPRPAMVRKKSGELVRPALRPSSARRRPTSMPGTPTFSKAVHFDSHLEHVRHFLQVDRPLAVSAGSSPVDEHEADADFPFSDESDQPREIPWEWELAISNFPVQTPYRLGMPARVERIYLSPDNKTLICSIAVANLSYQKWVVARYTLDYWKTVSEIVAEYNNDPKQPRYTDGCDRFLFKIHLADLANLEAKSMFFCVKYCVNGQEHWDNNSDTNFQVDFRKKPKPQLGKKGPHSAGARPAHSLPRSNKRAPAAQAKPLPTNFDDFADGFDAKYKFDDFRQPVNEYLGETGPPRLKGSQSAVQLSSDRPARRTAPQTQAFGNRYDFGASLSAAINAANAALGDRSGITMKPSTKKMVKKPSAPSTEVPSGPVGGTREFSKSPGTSTSTMSSLPSQVSSSGFSVTGAPTGDGMTPIASQSYSELLDKYCFFGSVKNSPQLKEGTLRAGQFDGTNDDGYMIESANSSVNNSPLMMIDKEQSVARIGPTNMQTSRSTSPAPMTGFVTGTSPMYPHSMNGGFSFHDAHTPTAIKG